MQGAGCSLAPSRQSIRYAAARVRANNGTNALPTLVSRAMYWPPSTALLSGLGSAPTTPSVREVAGAGGTCKERRGGGASTTQRAFRERERERGGGHERRNKRFERGRGRGGERGAGPADLRAASGGAQQSVGLRARDHVEVADLITQDGEKRLEIAAQSPLGARLG